MAEKPKLTIKDLDLLSWIADESMSPMPLRGAEDGGYFERADVIVAADGTDLNEFWQEVQATIALRNSYRTTLIDQLSYRVTGITEQVTLPGEADFEEASEYGQPVGFRAGSTRFFRGYDFKFYDLAVRYTWMAIAEMTRDQLQTHNNLALEADTKLIFRKVMQRLFNPLNSNGFTDKNEPVTVFAAYNGDGEVPLPYKQTYFNGQHNHFITSGNTAVTPQNLDDLANLTEEHGYLLQYGYRTVLWVNRQEADIIRTFRVLNGAKYDFVPNPNWYGGAVWIPTTGEYRGAPQGAVSDMEIGTYGPFHVVREDFIPAGYIVSVVTGGPNALANPIGIREHANPAYQGLKIIPGARADYPLVDSFYRRGIGTGIRQRGALALMQITNNATYTVPAAYDPANG